MKPTAKGTSVARKVCKRCKGYGAVVACPNNTKDDSCEHGCPAKQCPEKDCPRCKGTGVEPRRKGGKA